MNSLNRTKTEEPCIAYPWRFSDNNDLKLKPTIVDYLDRTGNIKMKYSDNTLTTLACGILPNVTTDIIEEFCERGVSMVVFDFHDLSYEQSRQMINDIRQGVFNYSLHKNDQIPYSLTLVLDLIGSRIITGIIFNTNPDQYLIELPTNSHVYLTNDIEYKNKCTADRVYVSSDTILRLKENDRIFLDYGKIELIVESVEFTLDDLTDDMHSLEYIYVGTYVVTDFEEVYCMIKRGEFLGSEKVVHISGIPIGIKALTEQDEEDIRTGIQLKVDAIMIPGIRNVSFFNRVKYFVCEEKGSDIDLYAKIDNSVGLENIDEIIPNVDAVFLHRPNLYMEIGIEKIFMVQKAVLTKCNIVGKPTVTHGGFLSSMEYNTAPLNAEVNDVITTVLDGTDCVYLDVTKRSAHQVHCVVDYASSICQQGDVSQWNQQLFVNLRKESKTKIDPIHAISIGCVEVSLKCPVAAIIVITTSGLSAKIIAQYRPKCPVLAIVRHGKYARKLCVWRNLISVHYIDPLETTWSKDVTNRTQFAIDFARKRGILNQGDLVLQMRCYEQNAGFTNTMTLLYVDSGHVVET